jgi:hypothetical protein
MRYFFCILLVVGLPIFAGAQDHPLPSDTIATHYQLLGADCALFPAVARLPQYLDYWVTRTGRFTPTQQQVAAVEKQLPTAPLEKLYDHRPTSYYVSYPSIIRQNIAKYQLQYFGLYNEAHQPCLFINLFIENVKYEPNTIPGWLIYPIHQYDGGAAYWSIYYNLSTQRFYNFRHNLEG